MTQKGVYMGLAQQAHRHKFIEVIDGKYKGARGVVWENKFETYNKPSGERIFCILYCGGEEIEFNKKPNLIYREIRKHESLEEVEDGEKH